MKIPKLPTMKTFRRLLYKLILVVIFVMLLWMLRKDNNFQFWISIKHMTFTLKEPVQDSVPRLKGPGLTVHSQSANIQPSENQTHTDPPHPPKKVEPRTRCPTSSMDSSVLQGQPASLLSVNGTKTLLLSAYLEHRTKEKQVRIIAIVLRSESISFHCHLHCQKQLYTSVGVRKDLEHHFDFPYGTAEIMCPLPPGCETPSRVTVTSSATKNQELADLNPWFLEVKNQKAVTESLPYNFTVCFSTMFNFTNVLQLVQSLEMLQLLGVNRVVIYKTNCSADTQKVLDYYTSKGLVEVIPWSLSNYLNPSRGFIPDQDPGDIHYFGQMPALNDFLYRYMYRSRYVALHDVDELILPQSVDSWLKLLPLLEKKFSADKCYMFENNVFPKEFALPPPKGQILPPADLWENIPGVNILTHLYREPITPKFKWSKFKIIVNPRAVFTVTVHGVLRSQKGCIWVNSDIARMYHTRPQMLPEMTPNKLIYDGRLLSYSTHLTQAVTTVLRESGLLPEGSEN